MNRLLVYFLVAVNLVLAVALVSRFGRENKAMAQVRGRPSDYIMIPGEINGGSNAVVYLIDTSNGLLGAMSYDDASHRLDTMPPIDLNRVFANSGVVPNPAAGTARPGNRIYPH